MFELFLVLFFVVLAAVVVNMSSEDWKVVLYLIGAVATLITMCLGTSFLMRYLSTHHIYSYERLLKDGQVQFALLLIVSLLVGAFGLEFYLYRILRSVHSLQRKHARSLRVG